MPTRCGAIPTFIHIGDGKLHDVNVLDLSEPGAFYVIHRGYPDFERLYALHQAWTFRRRKDQCASGAGKAS